MSTLYVERWEATTLRSGGMTITFDAPAGFEPAGDVVAAGPDQDTGALSVTWSDGSQALFLDGFDLDLGGGLEVVWTAEGLLRGAEMRVPCNSAW